MTKKKILSLALVLAFALTASLTMTSCRSGENGEIYVYCYGDYFDPIVIDKFEEETGIGVILDTYDTAEELYTVLSNSNSTYDCICTSDYMIGKMIEEGMLAEIDYDNIPAIKNLDEKYLKMAESFDPGNKYSVPHAVGTCGIIYNTKMVGDTVIDSWDDLWDEQFSGELVMPNSVRDAFMISLIRNGNSLNSTDESEIASAADELIKQKPLVYRYANDSARDLLADGSAAIGVVWNGEYMYTKDLNEDVEFVIPKEGTEFFVDSWAIPKDAANKELAEKWINFLCKAKIAAINFEYLHYTIPNKAAYELIGDEYLENEAIYPSEETLSKCTSLKTMDSETMDIYSKYWKKVKAK